MSRSLEYQAVIVDEYAASVSHLLTTATTATTTTRTRRKEEEGAAKKSKQAPETASSSNRNNNNNKSPVNKKKKNDGSLLPRPMQLMRDGTPLHTEYKYRNAGINRLRDGKLTGECSCQNPKSNFKKCCKRRILRTHKMGCVMTKDLFDAYDGSSSSQSQAGGQIRRVTEPHSYTYTKGLPRQDFRDVLVLRNLYDAIVSGYLYHIDGRECWKTGKGEPIQNPETESKPYLQKWYEYLSYDIVDPPRRNRSMCQYMADESEENGMRAYVGKFTFLALHFALQFKRLLWLLHVVVALYYSVITIFFAWLAGCDCLLLQVLQITNQEPFFALAHSLSLVYSASLICEKQIGYLIFITAVRCHIGPWHRSFRILVIVLWLYVMRISNPIRPI